jgi:hypothetical protein
MTDSSDVVAPGDDLTLGVDLLSIVDTNGKTVGHIRMPAGEPPEVMVDPLHALQRDVDKLRAEVKAIQVVVNKVCLSKRSTARFAGICCSRA